MASTNQASTAQTHISGKSSSVALVLRRAALDRLINGTRQRLVIITGPAGFGKTTLLRQYADYRAGQGDALAWVRMGSEFSDPAQFIRRLSDACSELANSNLISDQNARRSRQKISLRDLGAMLRHINTRGVIVVDNYEQGDKPGLDTLLTQLIRLLPSGLQLCIGARALPTVRLSAAHLDEDVLILNENDLRFQPEETQRFFSNFPQISMAEIDEIHTCSDGWPAALQCFRLCMQRGRQHRSAAYAGKGVTPDLINFLAAEVFEQLDTDMQHQLLVLCIPETLSAELTENILNCNNGQQLLEDIEQAGLFLTNIDLRGEWYRFHNLFRQFLLNRLTRSITAHELRRRHTSIGAWYTDHGYSEQAIQHLIEAKDTHHAAALLNELADDFVAEERLGLLEHYADQLAPEQILAHPALANATIIAYSFRRAFTKARSLLTAARAVDEGKSSNWDFAETFLLAGEDRIAELGAHVGEIGNAATSEDGRFRQAISLNGRAMWLYAKSEFEPALNLLLRARSLHDDDHSLFGQAYQEAIHSMAISAQGRLTEAAAGLTTALRRTETDTAGSVTAGSVIAAYLAEAHYELNRVEESKALIADYAQLAEQQAIVDPLAVMLLTHARVMRLENRPVDTRRLLERLIYLGHRYGLPRLVDYGNAEIVRNAVLDGDLGCARSRLDTLGEQFGKQGRSNDSDLLFHAGETELHSITWCRYLIAAGRAGEARSILAHEIRQARVLRRYRREAKLQILLALATRDDNRAHRTLLKALEIAAPQGMIRSFLDEGKPVLRLLLQLRDTLPNVGNLAERDVVVDHVDRILSATDEAVAIPAAGQGNPEHVPQNLLESLTAREKDLLRHVSRGLSNNDLADRLCISTNTVKWHLRNIFEKLQIKNRLQAVSVARNLGLID